MGKHVMVTFKDTFKNTVNKLRGASVVNISLYTSDLPSSPSADQHYVPG